MNLPQVTHFGSYRDFLKAYYKYQKKYKTGWSYQVWSKQMKLKSASSLLMIIQGKRNPSKKLVEKFYEYFKFTHFEKEYFSDLIRLNTLSGDPRLKKLLLKKMRQEQPMSPSRLLSHEECKVLSHWQALAIRQSTRLKEFKEDARILSSKLNFDSHPEEIEKSIAHLLKIGALIRDGKGILKAAPLMLDVPRDEWIESLQRNHQQQLKNAIEIQEKMGRNIHLSEMTGATLPIRLVDLKAMKDLIRRFKSEFLKVFDAPKEGEEVYQLEIALFPLTRYTTELDTVLRQK